jgi:4-amino-4-deoxy-L-arabinose transferase-like glycosyltransferase
MVLIALTLRLVVMTFLLPDHLSPEKDHWSFGYEAGRLARSIAQGHGFSSPLFGDTGPSAWLAPLYPGIIALFFSIFGIYTKASAIAILSFQALVSALTCLPVFFIARRCFGPKAALWSGWAWAFFPYAIYFPAERIWGTWLATFLLACLFLMTLQLAESATPGRWLRYGLLWGVTALTEPVVLTVLFPLGLWAAFRQFKRKQLRPAGVVLSSLAFFVVITPWLVRNYVVFHEFIPIRDGFGLSLILGTKAPTNHWATYGVGVGPWHSESEWQEFQRSGELNYMKREQRLAMESIRQYPGWFAIRTARRIVFLWTGFWSFERSYLAEEDFDIPNIPLCTTLTVLALLGLWRTYRRDPALAVPYASMILFFPMIYYVTSPEDYYRRPLDPILVVLAVSVLSSRKWRRSKGDKIPVGGAVAARSENVLASNSKAFPNAAPDAVLSKMHQAVPDASVSSRATPDTSPAE